MTATTEKQTLAQRLAHKTPPRWSIPWISRTHVALYKLTGGVIGANLAGKPGILVRTIGAKSGKVHTVCLPCVRDGDDRLIVASYAGGPRNPAWYHNLRAHPEIVVRDRRRVFMARAEVVGENDRPRVWQLVVDDAPWYADYQTRTTRLIPVVRLVETGPYLG
jgi:deazaflavin-dependent oxidoreductase (nitroreductase family)